MGAAHINENKVEHQAKKRQRFHVGLFLHFTVYVVVNVILWAVWLLIPDKGNGIPALPLIVTGAWTVMLIVHALILAVSHSPQQVAHDEVQRQVEDHRPNNP